MLKIAIWTFKNFVILLIIFFNINFANGEVVDIFSPLKQTPNRLINTTISQPEIFSTSNDLTRNVGSFYVAKGELLYLKGKVVDAFGIPIEGATIKIWQTNSSGHYQSLLDEESNYIDENFVMSGTARTDNLGRYGFKTIFPGFEENRAPHIYMTISHRNFDTIETELYFKDHPLNEKDPYYMSYDLEDRIALTADVVSIDEKNIKDGKVATFNIVMDGIHPYKGY